MCAQSAYRVHTAIVLSGSEDSRPIPTLELALIIDDLYRKIIITKKEKREGLEIDELTLGCKVSCGVYH